MNYKDSSFTDTSKVPFADREKANPDQAGSLHHSSYIRNNFGICKNEPSDFQIELSGKGVKREDLKKRARSKYFTDRVVLKLAELDSVLKKSYEDSISCTNVLWETKGGKFKTRFCKKRWCIVCSRIRTAQLIKTYLPVIEEFKDPWFLTLSRKSVPAERLREETRDFVKLFQKAKNLLRKRDGIHLKGTRNLEFTYNPEKDSYHPHFHIIIEGEEAARGLLETWFKYNPLTYDENGAILSGAHRKGQDLRPFRKDSKSLLEAFKYSNKIISDSRSENGKKDRAIYSYALDNIHVATKGGEGGTRLFQAFGIKRVQMVVTLTHEEFKEIQKMEEIANEIQNIFKWEVNESDWINTDSGEVLTGYQPSKNISKILDGIH